MMRLKAEKPSAGPGGLPALVSGVGSEYDLKLADVYAALAYDFAHRESVDASISDGEDEGRRLREESPSLLE
jgi:hypothetical protein